MVTTEFHGSFSVDCPPVWDCYDYDLIDAASGCCGGDGGVFRLFGDREILEVNDDTIFFDEPLFDCSDGEVDELDNMSRWKFSSVLRDENDLEGFTFDRTAASSPSSRGRSSNFSGASSSDASPVPPPASILTDGPNAKWCSSSSPTWTPPRTSSCLPRPPVVASSPATPPNAHPPRSSLSSVPPPHSFPSCAASSPLRSLMTSRCCTTNMRTACSRLSVPPSSTRSSCSVATTLISPWAPSRSSTNCRDSFGTPACGSTATTTTASSLSSAAHHEDERWHRLFMTLDHIVLRLDSINGVQHQMLELQSHEALVEEQKLRSAWSPVYEINSAVKVKAVTASMENSSTVSGKTIYWAKEILPSAETSEEDISGEKKEGKNTASTFPPGLACGESDFPTTIPSNATLQFDGEVLSETRLKDVVVHKEGKTKEESNQKAVTRDMSQKRYVFQFLKEVQFHQDIERVPTDKTCIHLEEDHELMTEGYTAFNNLEYVLNTYLPLDKCGLAQMKVTTRSETCSDSEIMKEELWCCDQVFNYVQLHATSDLLISFDKHLKLEDGRLDQGCRVSKKKEHIIQQNLFLEDIPKLTRSLEVIYVLEYNPIFLKKPFMHAMDIMNRKGMTHVLPPSQSLELFSTKDITAGFILLLHDLEQDDPDLGLTSKSWDLGIKWWLNEDGSADPDDFINALLPEFDNMVVLHDAETVADNTAQILEDNQVIQLHNSEAIEIVEHTSLEEPKEFTITGKYLQSHYSGKSKSKKWQEATGDKSIQTYEDFRSYVTFAGYSVKCKQTFDGGGGLSSVKHSGILQRIKKLFEWQRHKVKMKRLVLISRLQFSCFRLSQAEKKKEPDEGMLVRSERQD